MNKESDIHQVVKKCAEETMSWGRMVLEGHKLGLNGHNAGDETITWLGMSFS